MAEEKKQIETVINTGTFNGSLYSQIARVTVTNIDVTIEFGFIIPAEPTKGQVVTRVTMPLASGLDLAKTILQTQSINEKRIKGDKND